MVMSARRIDKLKEVAAKCTGKNPPLLVPLDVTDYNASVAAYASVMESCQHVDMMVLNAGRSQRMSGLSMKRCCFVSTSFIIPQETLRVDSPVIHYIVSTGHSLSRDKIAPRNKPLVCHPHGHSGTSGHG